MKTYSLPTIITILLMTTLIFQACGGAVNNIERENTYAAQRADAEDAYNSGQYDKAIAIYDEILLQNPTDEEVRTRLAFAYNGKAGLTLLDLVAGFAALSDKSGNSESRLVEIMGIMGLDQAEKDAVTTSLALTLEPTTTMANFRQTVTKAQIAHNSWLSLCRFIPKDMITALSQNGSLDTIYGINDPDKCGAGSDETKPSSAIAISGLFALLSETSILFQVVLDKNSDGKIDIIASMDSTTTNLTTTGDVTTSPTSLDAVKLSLTATAEILNNLSNFAEIMSGEVFNVLFANITAMGSLVVLAPGIPADVVKSIRASLARFRDQQDNIRGFLKGSLSNTKGLTTQRKLLANAGKKTSRGLDVLARGLKALGQDDAQIKETLATACQPLENFITQYGFESVVTISKKC